MMVTVVRDRRVPAFPDHPGRPAGERAYVLPASSAFTRSYRADAHFMSYASPVNRRLRRDAIKHFPVMMTCLAFDVDCPEVHGFPVPAPDKWRANIRIKMHYLHQSHPGFFMYETRGGCRIVFAADRTIATSDDERAWSQEYAVAICYLARRFSIVADPACADWTRLLRLPRATRDPGGEPEPWEMFGDPEDIQPLTFSASPDDVAMAKRTSKAFEPVVQRSYQGPIAGDSGLFHRMLSARGHVYREHRGGGWVIRCPNAANHSSGKDGDGSTILLPPSAGQALGWPICKHAHCTNISASEWVRMFEQHEVERAGAK